MSTAQTLVTQVLEILNLSNDLLQNDPRHERIAFRSLCDVLLEYRANGIYLTPRIPASITQEVSEKSSAKLGLIYKTAFYCAVPLQIKQFPPTFDTVRAQVEDTLYINNRPSTDQQFPETLPIGMGNEQYYGYNYYYRFYERPDCKEYQVYDKANRGEACFLFADFDPDAVLSDTKAGCITWDILTGVAELSDGSLDSNTSSALVKFVESGEVTIRARAEMCNKEIKDFLFKIEVCQ